MKPEKLFADINCLHAKNIIHAQSTAENAVAIGVKFHQLKELLPHGEFEASARAGTKISDPTRSRYMCIAEERLIEDLATKLLNSRLSPQWAKVSPVKLLTGGKSSTVELLGDPEMQAIPSEIRDQARAQVRAPDFKWTSLDLKARDLARGLESTDLMDLYRKYGVLREKKPKQYVPPSLTKALAETNPEPPWAHIKGDLLMFTLDELREAPTKDLRELQTLLQAVGKLVATALQERKTKP